MPRLPRLQYPVAIYHSLTHGDRQIDSVDPSVARLRELVYVEEVFLKRIQSMAEGNDPMLHRRKVRSIRPIVVDAIISATAAQYEVAVLGHSR